MRRLRFAVVLLLACGADRAEACHRFSTWRYPWPQRCDAPKAEPKPTASVPAMKPEPGWGEDELRIMAIEKLKILLNSR